MIEFALAASILIPLFLGTFQFGYSFYVYDILTTQVRAGARFASMTSFTAKDATSITAFKTATKNMVLYGNPTASGSILTPGLSAANVDVQVKTKTGATADDANVPAYVEVKIINYTVDAGVKQLTFNNKPYVYFPFTGRYAPAE